MKRRTTARGFSVTAVLAMAWLAACQTEPGAPGDPAVRVGAHALGGTVASARGPEAGVWVIAETDDLPTKFARIVVTDDRGRYLVPNLPTANYRVWVRGYGLVDSPQVKATPGSTLDLKAVTAPSAAAAAEYYPAIYWYSMLKVPARSGFGDLRGSQEEWLDNLKTDGCYTCHQLGNKATRTLPAALGRFENSTAAWTRRIQSGQASE